MNGDGVLRIGNSGEGLEIKEGERESSFGNVEFELLFQYANDDVKRAAEHQD